MESITTILNTINGYVWGPFTLILLLGTGIYLTIGLRLLTLRKLVTGFRYLWQGRKPSDAEGDITPFNALMTALSATVGTGNIVGVAGAIAIGGPGAIFWMWITALVGMATKYASCSLALKFRHIHNDGSISGGPMYTLLNGLKMPKLAALFALFTLVASFGIGNMVQANSVVDGLARALPDIPQNKTFIGFIMAILVGLVIIGGIKRIAKVASVIVPFMAVAYCGIALLILVTNYAQIPDALWTIINLALNPMAAGGTYFQSLTFLFLLFLGQYSLLISKVNFKYFINDKIDC